ncbi:Uncharacterized protein Rs2_39156 [Raphanus sativus]|nr:Uncharacterized protein Rs2_39156 [Raphanus sativus]
MRNFRPNQGSSSLSSLVTWLRMAKIPAFQVCSPLTTLFGVKRLCQKPTNLILFECLVLTNLILFEVSRNIVPGETLVEVVPESHKNFLANMVWVHEEFLIFAADGLLFTTTHEMCALDPISTK